MPSCPTLPQTFDFPLIFSFAFFKGHLLRRCFSLGKPNGTGQHVDPVDSTAECSTTLSKYWCHFKRPRCWIFEFSRWRRKASRLPNTDRYSVNQFVFDFKFLSQRWLKCSFIRIVYFHFKGILIPNDIENLSQFRTRASFILVVEKDSTFQKLIDDKIERFIGDCILITVCVVDSLNVIFLGILFFEG